MKRLLKRITIFLICITVGLSQLACNNGVQPPINEAEENPLMVKSTYSTQIYTRNDDISALSPGKFAISAAKGEKESAHVIVRPTGDIATYDFRLSDLKDGNGNTISKDNLTLYTAIYARVVVAGNFPAGYYPDCLIPIEYIKKQAENTIKAGNNQSFYLDVNVPTDTVAGIYTGTATFVYDHEEKAIDISLKVYDFEMPEVTSAQVTYLIWRDWLIQGEMDNSVEKWTDYFDFLLDYGIIGYDLPVEIWDIEGYKSAVRKYYDKVNHYYVPYTDPTFNTSVDPINRQNFYDHLYAIAEISIEDGINYFDKAQYYIHSIADESLAPVFAETKLPQTKRLMPFVDEIEESVVADLIESGQIASAQDPIVQALLGIEHVFVNPYNEEFHYTYGVTKYCPGNGEFDTTYELQKWDALREEGVTFISYGAGQRGAVDSVTINDYTLAGRNVFWSKFQNDVKGDLFWNATGYCAWWQTNVAGGYGLLNDLYTQASHDGLTNGDGYLMYPGALYGSDMPFPSIRLLQRRDGIEDYDYMSVLKNEYESLSKEYGTTNDIHNTLACVYDEITSLFYSKLSHESTMQMRDLIADLIVMAQSDAGFVLNNMQFGYTGVELEMYVKEGTALKINDEVLTGTQSGTGQKISVTIPYGNIKIEVAKDDYSKVALFFAGEEPVQLKDFTEEDQLLDILLSNRGTQAVSIDTTTTLSGSSLKAILGGLAEYATHRPYVGLPVNGVADLSYIEFCVYNPSNKAILVNVVARNNSVDVNYNLDTIELKAESWTKIKVGNFTKIDVSKRALGAISHIMLTLDNNPVVGGLAVTETLYLDNVYYKTNS